MFPGAKAHFAPSANRILVHCTNLCASEKERAERDTKMMIEKEKSGRRENSMGKLGAKWNFYCVSDVSLNYLVENSQRV